MTDSGASGLTVAVTGPTGDIGRSLLRALERSRQVGRISAMARRPFDPAAEGLRKTVYRQADVLDADAVREVVAGADVVVHLAFMIMGSVAETTRINLDGSRNVFAAAIDSGAARLVYASSVAAYGFAADNPQPLTEDVEPRGTRRHYYSAQKAELEHVLRELLTGSDIAAYVFRPCIVAGPDALALVQNIPYVQLSERMPAAVRRALEFMPALRPVIPDPGIPFQLVHHDDVATALRAAVLGRGEPGVYNLAGDGTLTLADVADALGLVRDPRPRPGDGGGRRGRRPGAVRARRGAVDREPAPARGDGHHPRPAAAGVAAPPRRSRDPASDGRRRPGRAAHPLTTCRR